jgi:ankyrin repeat protein
VLSQKRTEQEVCGLPFISIQATRTTGKASIMSAKSSRSSPGGNALLDEAIHDEDKHAVQFLLDHGVIPNDRNLAIAIDSGDVDMVRFLFLSNNADFSQKARQVALEWSVWKNCPDLLQLVLEVDHADPNFLISWVPYDDHDDVPNITWTPLHLAMYRARGFVLPLIALECVEPLITYGAQVNSQNAWCQI